MTTRTTYLYPSWSRMGYSYYKAQKADATRNTRLVLTDYMVGSDDRKWRDKILRGENATGTLLRTRYLSEVVSDSMSTQKGIAGTVAEYEGGVTLNHGIAPYVPTDLNNASYWNTALAQAENGALVAIRNKITSAQASFGGLTALAELRQTIKGLRNPGKALVETLGSLIENVALHNKARNLKVPTCKTAKCRRLVRYRQLRASRGGKAALVERDRLLSGKTFAQTWLEFKFGWTPLANDCKNIAEGLTKYFWQDQMIRVFGSYPAQSSVSEFVNNTNAGINCEGYSEIVTTVKVKYAVGIKRTLTGPKGPLGMLASESGSINDIFPAFWEIIPWSFLIDYVSNIGDIINAWSASNTGVVWVSKTTFISVVKTTSMGPVNRQYFELTARGRSVVRSEFQKITRQKLSAADLGVPGLQFTLPGDAQLFNVAALLRTFLKK